MANARERAVRLHETIGDGVVVLHDTDPDGYGAAWAISKFLPRATFLPVPHGRPNWGYVRKLFPQVADFQHLVVTDLCFSRETMLSLMEKYETVTVLDHHATAKDAVGDLPCSFIDTNYSAAMLAWRFFHGPGLVPRVIEYIQDYDLWRHQLQFTHEIFSLIQSHMHEMDFGKLDEIDFMLGDRAEDGRGFDYAVRLGSAALGYRRSIAQICLEHVRRISFEGHDVPCANVSSPLVVSDVGHLLDDGEPFSVTWFQQGDGTYKYSLRSRFGDEGQPQALNVAEIAARHGGGGHARAAGFMVNERID